MPLAQRLNHIDIFAGKPEIERFFIDAPYLRVT